MSIVAERLSQRQSWVGELKSPGMIITVTLVLYGEAAVSLACNFLMSEYG
jgi:hypothetical protein